MVVTPYNWLAITLVPAYAPSSPSAAPAAIIHTPCLSINVTTERGLAPRATRIPISFVLLVTVWDITP